MKLDRIHEIACVCSAIMVCLPFFVDWVIADIPDWGWHLMTAMIAIAFGTMAVTYLMRKSRDWDREHGRSGGRRKRR